MSLQGFYQLLFSFIIEWETVVALSITQNTTHLLDAWATLLPGQYRWLSVNNVSDLYADTFKQAGLKWAMWHPVQELSVLVGTLPSWLLPPVHPAFRFEEAEPLLQPSQERYDLWLTRDDGVKQLNPVYFERLFSTRMARNWWLRYLPGAAERLRSRLLSTRPLFSVLQNIIAERYGSSSTIVSVVLTGSFLWSEVVPHGIDVAVLIDSSDPAFQCCFDHCSEISLHEPLVVKGEAVSYIDLMVVGTGCLKSPSTLKGTLGQWLTKDGDLFPHDLHKRTVYCATQQTFAAGIPIYGKDFYQQVQQHPRDLLALAYYFTQVASALLVYREGSVKAAQRLLEGNLILNLWEELTGAPTLGEAQGIVESCLEILRYTRTDPENSQFLADLQGWWGREPKSLLNLTVARLVHATSFTQPAMHGELAPVGPLGAQTPMRDEKRLLPSPAAQALGEINVSAAERELLIPFMDLLSAELASQRVRERCRIACQSREPAWSVLLAKLENTSYVPDLARLVYALTVAPADDGDRHLLARTLSTAQTKQYVIRDITLSSEEVLIETLVLYERYRRLLPRSHYFNSASFFEMLAEYEQATELCALTNGFLGGIPVWMWLSEPLKDLPYDTNHVQSALRNAQERYYSRFTHFNGRPEDATSHNAQSRHLRTARSIL